MKAEELLLGGESRGEKDEFGPVEEPFFVDAMEERINPRSIHRVAARERIQ
jgi:hypothetical protein